MNGILLIDKPEGWTSHDIAAKLKGMLRERRIGHSGTLDPMATGLLVMFVGRATRAVEFAEAQSKRYIAGLRLGVSTDTQDTTGNILRSCEASVTREALADAIKPFIGDIMQIPPMYSAIKVNGQKLYDIARRGGEVERKPRPVTIHGIEILGGEKADWTLDVECSKGTYIRTLCNDIGESLNVGGCMSRCAVSARGSSALTMRTASRTSSARKKRATSSRC
ncbi:MAG: tRNA pseudouridine(55) synthase TruB [Oscillospiraceae bacterium]